MKSRLTILLVILLLLVGCTTPPERILQTAVPNTKPPPQESLTVITGYELTDLFSILFTSLIVASLLVTGLSILMAVIHFRTDGQLRFPGLGRLLAGTFIVFLIVFGLQSLSGALATVPAGSVGVKLRNGAAQESTLAPGFHWITPYINQVATLSTREFTYITTSHVDTASEDFTDFKVGARTCDGVDVEIPYTIKFKIQSSWAPKIFTEYGSVSAVEERVVKALSRQIVREVPTQFSSVALYASSAIIDSPELITDEFLRTLVTEAACGEQSTGFDNLNEQIRQELAGEFEEVGVVLTFFGVRQPDLGSFGEKLDSVRIASKDVEIARINTVVAEAEKQAAFLKAEGEAEADRVTTIINAEAQAEARQQEATSQAAAAKILAEAEADNIRTKAEAEADANRELANSLSPELANFLLSKDRISAWDGRLPAFGELRGMTPILDVTELITQSNLLDDSN